ncbi:MAG TPA: Hsp20/alpha crystallin family protein [Polyangiaceae bacterium]|nr:Hsp20/alpha crystallin family protein [Polyangiaceae bacterium]
MGFHRRRSPGLAFDVFDGLRRDMERLFAAYGRAETTPFRPRFSLEDTGEALVVRAEVPGLEQKDLELSLEADTVTLKGERKEVVPEGYTPRRRECLSYRFTRTLPLPTKVDVEKAEAVLAHGVLTLTLPKVKEAQPRRIPVRTGSSEQ